MLIPVRMKFKIHDRQPVLLEVENREIPDEVVAKKLLPEFERLGRLHGINKADFYEQN